MLFSSIYQSILAQFSRRKLPDMKTAVVPVKVFRIGKRVVSPLRVSVTEISAGRFAVAVARGVNVQH